MNLKQLSSMIPPEVLERAFQLYYEFFSIRKRELSEDDFIKEMDEFITSLEGGLNLG